MTPRIVLLHGVATTAAIWTRVIAQLEALGITDAIAVERPCTGDLESELDALEPLTKGALVVGQSGGATLALALSTDRPGLAGALCHEPAVGSLVPELLTPVAAAMAERGVPGFGAALYGDSFTLDMVGDPEAVPRELAMFRAFEPEPASKGSAPTLITVGELSPPVRHRAASALQDRLGYRVAVLPGARHFAAWDSPASFARLIADTARGL